MKINRPSDHTFSFYLIFRPLKFLIKESSPLFVIQVTRFLIAFLNDKFYYSRSIENYPKLVRDQSLQSAVSSTEIFLNLRSRGPVVNPAKRDAPLQKLGYIGFAPSGTATFSLHITLSLSYWLSKTNLDRQFSQEITLHPLPDLGAKFVNSNQRLGVPNLVNRQARSLLALLKKIHKKRRKVANNCNVKIRR